MSHKRLSEQCPTDDSYMLLMGGFSSNTHQTEAFTYYCVKCKTGYTYIRLLTSDMYEVLRWIDTGTHGFELAPESWPTAGRYQLAIIEKCAAGLASGIADFRKHRHVVPTNCPLDSCPMAPPLDSFLVGGTRTVILHYCGRCNHYHCYGADPDYGWQYLVSVTVDPADLRHMIMTQKTTDDIAQECVRAIRSFVAGHSG